MYKKEYTLNAGSLLGWDKVRSMLHIRPQRASRALGELLCIVQSYRCRDPLILYLTLCGTHSSLQDELKAFSGERYQPCELRNPAS